MTRVIDIAPGPVNDSGVDMDDHAPIKSDEIAALQRQDLDPLSVDELNERIAALEAEIARTRLKLERAVNHRATAEDIFKR